MNVLFSGSSEFSLPSLKSLMDSAHKVVACLTTPSKPKGRGLKIESNCVQALAEEKGVKCLAPDKLNDPKLLEQVKQLSVDVLAVASYGKLLPASWLNLPKKFAVNVHPSLLPLYRGAAPINWQIIRGDLRTGVTIFKVETGLDSGDILAQKEMSLESSDNAISLSKKLAEEGAQLLMKVLEQIECGSVQLTPQDHGEATYAPKLKKEDGAIDWKKSAVEISNLVRGVVPWPSAYIFFRGGLLKVLSAKVADVACAEGKPGEILEINKAGFIRVQTGRGALMVEQVRPEGKREMTAHEFSIGHHLGPGMTLSTTRDGSL